MVAVVDGVEVVGEDRALREQALEPERQAGLLELALERSLTVADVEVARELLCDRRAALGRPPGVDVPPRRPRDRLVVERPVLPEAAILDRDGCPRQPPRHLPQLQP